MRPPAAAGERRVDRAGIRHRADLIEGGRLFYRGLDAVELSRTRPFEEVAGWLWNGRWRQAEPWPTPAAAAAAVPGPALGRGRALPVERFMLAVVAAALTDELRHDLSPAAVPIAGRGSSRPSSTPCPSAAGGPRRRPGGSSISERLWPRLSRCRSTQTASQSSRRPWCFRLTTSWPVHPGGPGGGRLSGRSLRGRSHRVGSGQRQLAQREQRCAQRGGDLLAEAWRATRSGPSASGCGGTGRWCTGSACRCIPGATPGAPSCCRGWARSEGVARATPWSSGCWRSASGRGFPPPNVDLGLGALAFCAEMIPGAGQAIATLGKVAGWLAHAMEEYAEPTRFRTRAAYIGSAPGSPCRRQPTDGTGPAVV